MFVPFALFVLAIVLMLYPFYVLCYKGITYLDLRLKELQPTSVTPEVTLVGEHGEELLVASE